MHRQQNTDNSTETQAQTSLCHTICICYISVMSTVFHPFTPCSQPFLYSRPSEEVWCHVNHTRLRNDEHTQRHVISSKPSLNATKTFSSCSAWRQSVQHLKNSHALAVSSLSNWNLSLQFLSLLFPFPCSSQTKLINQDFLLIDEIMWACCPRGCRFDRLPLATNSCNSGRKPGLDLQREIIECVFIHDQSLIQKVLGHLDRNIKGGRHSFRPVTNIYSYGFIF